MKFGTDWASPLRSWRAVMDVVRVGKFDRSGGPSTLKSTGAVRYRKRKASVGEHTGFSLINDGDTSADWSLVTVQKRPKRIANPAGDDPPPLRLRPFGPSHNHIRGFPTGKVTRIVDSRAFRQVRSRFLVRHNQGG